jgi:hypothetical protein
LRKNNKHLKWQEDKILTGADPEFLKNFLEGSEYGKNY